MQILSLTIDLHESTITLSRKHGFPFYDALITENMQDGKRMGALTIRNPFSLHRIAHTASK
jgi:predicted nucleic acid-binding protein